METVFPFVSAFAFHCLGRILHIHIHFMASAVAGLRAAWRWHITLYAIMKKISNGVLDISVAEHGAELCSIVCGGREYLWQADPKYWARHSPVLFPLVGRVWNNVYRAEGETYELGQHGFARDMDFKLCHADDTSLLYELRSSDATHKVYPYDFCLKIGYELHDNRVRVLWQVENTGKGDMYFQIGAHPAFYYPDFKPEEDRRCLFSFDRSEGLEYISPAEKGCVSLQRHTLKPGAEGFMEVDTRTFDCDTYIFDNSQLHRVTMLGLDRKPCVTLEFDSPLVALWSPSKTWRDVPFVCIEPWYGRCDSVGYEGDFKDREWMNRLEEGGVFRASYDIIIERQA